MDHRSLDGSEMEEMEEMEVQMLEGQDEEEEELIDSEDGFKPMKIGHSNQTRSRGSQCAVNCRWVTCGAALLAGVMLFFVTVSHTLLPEEQAADSSKDFNSTVMVGEIPAEPTQEPSGLMCYEASEVEGGDTGGHCSTVFLHHATMKRNVTFLENGVETFTYTDSAEALEAIIKHVSMMKHMVEMGHAIHQHDQLFQIVFNKAWSKEIELTYETKDNGLLVKQTSDNPCAVQLVHYHARTVSKFVEHGIPEFLCQHEIPSCILDQQ